MLYIPVLEADYVLDFIKYHIEYALACGTPEAIVIENTFNDDWGSDFTPYRHHDEEWMLREYAYWP